MPLTVPRNSIVLALAAGALTACARGPQVLTPVRIDPTSVPGAAADVGIVRRDPFAALDEADWPGPNSFRSADGSPGPEYWQQRADYTITAQLDTVAQRVSGRVTIRYTNHSPDTLRFVWLQLEQNLYRAGSKGSALYPAESRWGVRGFEGGFELSNITVNGRPARYRVDDTMMRVDLDAPLAPRGGRLAVAMDFAFRIPEHGSDRMGRDGTLYEIAQWYPRMAVYDDVRGWNAEPYLGQGEFYLEYGDFDYAVTAPAGYVIAGSGVLRNPEEVLTAVQRERLARAARSAEVVRVITADEAVPRPTPGTKTWRFRAENVRDVAWAGAPDFRWDATSWSGVLTQAFYPWPRAGRGWEDAAENTQWSIRFYSEMLYRYPYPQATSVAGPVGGMEYPMFAMVHYAEEPQGAFETIDHEHGHEWFPMIVGSNERRYAWMDEGLDTYINAFSSEARTPGYGAWGGYVANWRLVVDNGTQSPLMMPPDRVHPSALGAVGYRKPGAVLLTLRNAVVGRETFDRAFREYVRRWAFKHPTPGDFFRTVENYAGEDLAWFWRAFFYGADVLDIGVADVTMREGAGGRQAVISLRKETSIPFPVAMRLRCETGAPADVRLPVQIWARGDRFDAAIDVDCRVVGVRLWPDGTAPDWNAENDTWGIPPEGSKPAPVTVP